MKKLLILILAVGFWSAESKAQMQKGSWMLEGSAGLERSRSYFPDTDEKSNPVSGFTLHPKAGYFVADNLAIGLSGILGSSWSRNKDYDPNIPYNYKKGNTLNYGGGLFLRKYFPINETLSFFGGIESEIFWVRQKTISNEPSGKMIEVQQRAISANGTLGLQYLISPKLGVHMQTNLIQYEKTKFLLEGNRSRSEFRAGFLINPRFGFTIFL
ncbi:outer membrane beta-barrel protein [Algoriphagus litoralis]|uniref:outer membrane beta-barrel protein n=1 Tax=Algoriphagus litoralis TaxID=2202829 RepID=UPI000DBA92F5